jgi:uncharacterized protein
MHKPVFAAFLLCASVGFGADRKLSAVVVDGVNNHDWAAGTTAIRAILEASGRFTVDVSTFPHLPDFAKYDVVIDNFNGGHTEKGVRWPAAAERALEAYVRGGGGLVVFHAANNAFLEWPEFNRMIGLGWRPPTFGDGLAIVDGRVRRIAKGEGLPPGHGPRHDFELIVLDRDHPITRGLPARWNHPSEQLTHGQHGPAEGLTVLTYAVSEVSHQGEPMDWVRDYGKGRVYTTMLGHTWKDEPNPNLEEANFQALFARGVEWAANAQVTLSAEPGFSRLFNGKNLDGWRLVGGTGPGYVVEGDRIVCPSDGGGNLFTEKEYANFILRLEFMVSPGGNNGVGLRAPYQGDAAYQGMEIQVLDDPAPQYRTIKPAQHAGSIYGVFAAKQGALKPTGEWNSYEITANGRHVHIVLNGTTVVDADLDTVKDPEILRQHPGLSRASGHIGFLGHRSHVEFRNIRIKELP